ncbi:MAG: ADP-ribosylglycohydrolase family protein [Anaerolineae bacterium]|nr:ADP-ribosylglycohydrolase family protein [Candidatus Roseilinea sp.]MDW8449311.1 ADP-ribosylglycohydrolase family protein [Anaerolineae bacterium]
MALPSDYLERVYAGILGKIIGVYLGRPFEGWSYDRIMAELGEINYYVHKQRKTLLVVTDDDISGTFTFLRALPDYGNDVNITPAQIGQTWLNYIIERKTILWWGGMGNSTEHTAYLRLKRGVVAPESGSIALNGKVVAEQIGAQIFIDGWAMVAPGDPALAADLARRAASVSHDGEAIYGAQVIAAMEAQAFVERDLHKLIECAISFIPRDSIIYRLINDIREWRDKIADWRKARELLQQHYGYDKYGGNCHIVPNHGVIMLGLLYGDDDFQKSLMITNTAGWDTDCNSGNVGCLLGIKNGLTAIDNGPDWRGPVADRMYLPTADGGHAITDAANEAIRVVNIGRALAGELAIAPKDGARFHFELPGSVQGFMPEESIESAGTLTIENVPGHSANGARSLALRYHHVASGRSARVATATFIPPEAIAMPGYMLLASPTLYPGQTVRARIEADADNGRPIICRLYVRRYGLNDELVRVYGPEVALSPGAAHIFVWRMPDMGGQPIAEIGLELSNKDGQRADGVVYLDYLTWDSEPSLTFRRPAERSEMWRRAWVDGTDHYDRWWPEAYRVVVNDGTGLLITGAREWTDYRVSSTLTPHMCQRFGVAARVQGMKRFYALLLCAGGKAQLLRVLGGENILAESEFAWKLGNRYTFTIQVQGTLIQGWIDDMLIGDVKDDALAGGGIGLVCTEGRIGTDEVHVQAVK